jgi:hypothetical protein
MKKIIGTALVVLAVCFFVGGVAGGVIYFFYSTIMAILDAINLVKGTDPVTFWQVAGMVFFWVFREIIAIAIVIVSWLLGVASGSGGYAMLNGRRKTIHERLMENHARA